MHTDERPEMKRKLTPTIFFLLAVLAVLALPTATRAQWTTPDSNNNINNTNTGNVGVGTTTPGTPLDVRGADIGGSFIMRITNTTLGGELFQGVNSLGNEVGSLRTDEAGNGFITINNSAGTRKILLTSYDASYFTGGNIGIGTATPSQALTVAGFNSTGTGNTAQFVGSAPSGTVQNQLNITSTTNAWGLLIGQNNGGVASSSYHCANCAHIINFNSAPLIFGTGNAERVRIDSAGNFGVGTSTPLAGLSANAGMEVYSSSATTTLRIKTGVAGKNNAQMRFAGTSGDNWAIGSDVATDNGSRDFHFYDFAGTAGARMTIKSSTGSVGIGTQAPGFKLDVQGGQINASGGLCIAGVCKSDWSQVGGQWSNATGGINYGTGNVGVGTSTPGQLLDVQGTNPSLQVKATNGGGYSRLLLGNATRDWRIVNDGTNADKLTIYDGTAAATRMVIDTSGNVGVGTSAPGSKLFVGSGTAAGQALPGFNVALGGNSYVSAINGTVNTFIGSDTSTYGIVGTLTNHPLGLRANNTLAMTIMPDGKVGIGTSTPSASYKLDVAGSINASVNINATGAITGGTINATYQDVAEWVPSEQKLSAGTVVVLDTTQSNHVVASTTSYDTGVAGVVSAQPGITLGEGGAGKVLVATTGRVKVKVDATKGAIKVGDLLVTGELEGVAMKSEPVLLGGRKMHAPGTIIGKALEPLAAGTGEILVLLSLQ